MVRASEDDLTTLPFWVDTVEALLAATADIARAAQAGDAEALAEAQAAYAAAADDAERADQALVDRARRGRGSITGRPRPPRPEALRAVGRRGPRWAACLYSLTSSRGAPPTAPPRRSRRADAATR